ncbi:MAG: hypothetical protein L0H53_16195 [Candidatus Nitrosocosmicus sp.]|nr:hypothetical protein [Candidatus Nitrosocosmicus sp.]
MKSNSHIYIIMTILGTFALTFSSFEETSVNAQKLIPSPATNTTSNNFNQSSYPVIDRLVNDTTGMNQNNATLMQKDTAQPMINKVLDPNARITIVAENLFEIRDNIGEARLALNAGNLFELAEHINNLDNLVTVLLNPLPQNVTMLEQSKQTLP